MNPTFKITMENGVIEGELYPEKAPQSVCNFIAAFFTRSLTDGRVAARSASFGKLFAYGNFLCCF